MTVATEIEIRTLRSAEIRDHLPRLAAFVLKQGERSPARHPGWLLALQEGLGHEPHCLEALAGQRTVGLLPLCLVRSWLFGRFLVGMPYLNSGGVIAEDESAATALADRAAALADTLNVRYLELRHEKRLAHPALGHELTSKVHMRLDLPAAQDELWTALKAKVRNQIRKGEEHSLSVHWGGMPLLDDFYRVFAHNMRDLGTPVFGRRLFAAILAQFPDEAEFCVVRMQGGSIAAALLIHGPGVTEVPSASSLRRYNSTNANMWMYWQLLRRSIERGQKVFDFGRSTLDSNTFRFKKQWGAMPHQAVWQYFRRRGTIGDLRPDSGRYGMAIRVWKRLPVFFSRLLGPPIVRGIP